MKNEYAEREAVLKSMEMNLCDFALFLSVMKNKEAHEITLSIIMEDPNLQLAEVHVEEVVLNKSGKRAIRLDAWAKDAEGTQYNTEMQNDIDGDDIRKRSRFYQGLIDTPIMKSGKGTKYKQLPSTVIIFITKEDIFGEDLAKYTFTEQCEEVEGLHLDDGTTKIFLNMASKNGSPELVSLLQYMKKTQLDNPDVIIQDDRMRRLDSIVTEVKESEEWEAASMSIYSVAWENGIKAGRDEGLKEGLKEGQQKGEKRKLVELVCKKLRKAKPVEEIAGELEEDIAEIVMICEVAAEFTPEYDFEKVWAKWNDKNR